MFNFIRLTSAKPFTGCFRRHTSACSYLRNTYWITPLKNGSNSNQTRKCVLTQSSLNWNAEHPRHACYRLKSAEFSALQSQQTYFCTKSGCPSSEGSLSGGNESASSSTESFSTLYRFKYIVHLRVVARLKMYQTIATILAVPPSIYMYSANLMSTAETTAIFGISILACVMLYVISFGIQRVIGLISLSEKEEKVRISHLSFWGRRLDVVCDVDDIIPLSDISERSKNIFVVVKRYSSPNYFTLFLRHGQIQDLQRLQNILGPI